MVSFQAVPLYVTMMQSRQSCLKALDWARTMETDSSTVNAIGVPDISVIPMTQLIVDNKEKE